MLKLLPCLGALSCVQCCPTKSADTEVPKNSRNNRKNKKMTSELVVSYYKENTRLSIISTYYVKNKTLFQSDLISIHINENSNSMSRTG